MPNSNDAKQKKGYHGEKEGWKCCQIQFEGSINLTHDAFNGPITLYPYAGWI